MFTEVKTSRLPEWAVKIGTWVLLTVVTLYASSQVSKTRLDDLTKRQEALESQQKDQITPREFQASQSETLRRFDSLDKSIDNLGKKVDRMQERRERQ